jgi:hypothetical protein
MSKVTIFKNIKATSTGFDRTPDFIFDRIKSGASKDLVEAIRKADSKSERNELKKQLPSICWSGRFKNRTDKGLVEHSGIICLDFDDFEDTESMLSFKEYTKKMPYTYASFISPSGDGIKLLVKIPPCDKEEHKQYFESLETYFSSPYFDTSCSNISRVCYESYDKDIYINKESDIWEDKHEEDIIISAPENPPIILKSTNQIIQNIMTWFNKNYNMGEGSRNDNLFKLAICLSDYGIPQAEAESVCYQYIEKDFNQKEVDVIIRSAYKRGTLNFGSKYFEDVSTYNKIEEKIKDGRTHRDILASFPEHSSLEIEDAISQIHSTISTVEFWDFDKRGNIRLRPHKFKEFLEQNGYAKIYPNGSETAVFIEMDSNIVDNTSTQRIKDFTLQYLMDNSADFGIKPYDFMADNPNYFSEKYLSLLDSVDINFKEDTQDKCYLYYRNCAIEVTRHKITQIDYLNLNGFIWRKQIIDRDFSTIDFSDAEYKKFLWLVSGEQENRFNSLQSVVGFYLHSYKSAGSNRAVIANDEVISENPNGGSGKGLFAQALAKMKKVTILDGKQFDFKKSFPFQTVGVDTQVLVFDDVKKNFDFEQIFSLITEGITLEKKNKDAIHIPFKYTPKILISTNYTIGGSGGSHERRKFEIEFSAHFGVNHTPQEEFGHLLFDDWTDDQWLKFDNYMIYCLQIFLEEGLIQHDFVNLEKRKFIKETSFEFWEWSLDEDNIKIGTRYDKKELYISFIEEYTDYKKWLTQKKFSSWVEKLSVYKGVYYKTGKTQGQRWVMLLQNEPKEEVVQVEYFDNQDEELPF